MEHLCEHDKKFDDVMKQLREHSEILKKVVEKLFEYDKRFDEVDKTIKSMNRSIILIEDQVTTKIPTLFDAHTVNHDKIEEDSERIDNLENETENNSMRISILEETSKEHSSKLSGLVS